MLVKKVSLKTVGNFSPSFVECFHFFILTLKYFRYQKGIEKEVKARLKLLAENYFIKNNGSKQR
jgi:hypothetical protein